MESRSESESQIKEIFDKFCGKEPGYLSRDELWNLIEKVGLDINLTKEDANKIFNDVDSDGNERVDFQEFYEAIMSRKAHGAQLEESLKSPALRIIEFLKGIKLKNVTNFKLQKEVDWYVQKIQDKELYFSYITEDDKPKEAISDIFGWLSEYSRKKERYSQSPSPGRRSIFKPATLQKTQSTELIDLITLYNQHRDLFALIDTLDFDLFNFVDKVGHKNTLPLIAYHILNHHGVMEEMEAETLEKFIAHIALGYKKTNPYHNDIHAADALQMGHYIILVSDLKKIAQLDTLDIAAFLLSVIVHDYKHPGLNNNFLINSEDDLALTYNDKSVTENMHIAEAFKLMKDKPECDILRLFNAEDKKWFRARMLGMVLATDMSKHAEHESGLKSVISAFDIHNGNNAEFIISKASDTSENRSKQMILDSLLHAADISNPTRPFQLCKKWTYNLIDENWKQGDVEKEKGLPVSFLCDRHTVLVPNSQVGFLKGIILPYFGALAQIFVGLNPLLESAKNNVAQWTQLIEK